MHNERVIDRLLALRVAVANGSCRSLRGHRHGLGPPGAAGFSYPIVRSIYGFSAGSLSLPRAFIMASRAGPCFLDRLDHLVAALASNFHQVVDFVRSFSGVKVPSAERKRILDTSHAFTEAEWLLVRTIANDLERKHGWEQGASVRVRFLLDFSYATGLRAGELVGCA